MSAPTSLHPIYRPPFHNLPVTPDTPAVPTRSRTAAPATASWEALIKDILGDRTLNPQNNGEWLLLARQLKALTAKTNKQRLYQLLKPASLAGQDLPTSPLAHAPTNGRAWLPLAIKSTAIAAAALGIGMAGYFGGKNTLTEFPATIVHPHVDNGLGCPIQQHPHAVNGSAFWPQRRPWIAKIHTPADSIAAMQKAVDAALGNRTSGNCIAPVHVAGLISDGVAILQKDTDSRAIKVSCPAITPVNTTAQHIAETWRMFPPLNPATPTDLRAERALSTQSPKLSHSAYSLVAMQSPLQASPLTCPAEPTAPAATETTAPPPDAIPAAQTTHGYFHAASYIWGALAAIGSCAIWHSLKGRATAPDAHSEEKHVDVPSSTDGGEKDAMTDASTSGSNAKGVASLRSSALVPEVHSEDKHVETPTPTGDGRKNDIADPSTKASDAKDVAIESKEIIAYMQEHYFADDDLAAFLADDPYGWAVAKSDLKLIELLLKAEIQDNADYQLVAIVKHIMPNTADLATFLADDPYGWAIKKGDLVLIGLLIDAGYSPLLSNKASQQPLAEIVSTFQSDHPQHVLAIIDKLPCEGDWLHKLFATAEHEQIVNALITKMQDVNSADREGKTPLHYAVIGQNAKTLALLIENEARVDIADNVGKTPLYYAVANNQTEMIKTLVGANAKVDVVDKLGRPLLCYAIMQGCPIETIQLLVNSATINQPDREGSAPLHHALNRGLTTTSMSSGGHAALGIIDLLIKAGADPKATFDVPDTRKHKATSLPKNAFSPLDYVHQLCAFYNQRLSRDVSDENTSSILDFLCKAQKLMKTALWKQGKFTEAELAVFEALKECDQVGDSLERFAEFLCAAPYGWAVAQRNLPLIELLISADVIDTGAIFEFMKIHYNFEDNKAAFAQFISDDPYGWACAKNDAKLLRLLIKAGISNMHPDEYVERTVCWINEEFTKPERKALDFMQSCGMIDKARSFADFLINDPYRRALYLQKKALISLLVAAEVPYRNSDQKARQAFEQATRWKEYDFTAEEMDIFKLIKESDMIRSDKKKFAQFLSKDPYGWAVKNDDEELVQLLVTAGIVNANTCDGVCEAIYRAQQKNRWKRLEFTDQEWAVFDLIKEEDFIGENLENFADFLCDTPYAYAVKKGNKQLIKQLIIADVIFTEALFDFMKSHYCIPDDKADFAQFISEDPYGWAYTKEDLKLMLLLIETGIINTNADEEVSRAIRKLTQAIQKGRWEILKFTPKERELFALLHEKEWIEDESDFADFLCGNPFGYAMEKDDCEVIFWLVDAGIVYDGDDETILEVIDDAISYYKSADTSEGSIDIEGLEAMMERELREAGVITNGDETPLDVADGSTTSDEALEDLKRQLLDFDATPTGAEGTITGNDLIEARLNSLREGTTDSYSDHSQSASASGSSSRSGSSEESGTPPDSESDEGEPEGL